MITLLSYINSSSPGDHKMLHLKLAAWFRWWLGSWKHQAITWINIDWTTISEVGISLFSNILDDNDRKYIWKLCFNALPCGDIIWKRTLPILVQVMAYCQTVPSHYLELCWLLISEILWHLSQSIILEEMLLWMKNLFLKIKLLLHFSWANELIWLSIYRRNELIGFCLYIHHVFYLLSLSLSFSFELHLPWTDTILTSLFTTRGTIHNVWPDWVGKLSLVAIVYCVVAPA